MNATDVTAENRNLLELSDLSAARLQADRREVFADADLQQALVGQVNELRQQHQQGEGDPKELAMRIALGCFLQGRAAEALSWLSHCPPSVGRSLLGALCHRELNQWSEGLEDFKQAQDAGADRLACQIGRAECLIGLARYDEAQKLLDRNAEAGAQRADWQCVCGLLAESQGDTEQAMDFYEAALAIDEGYVPAVFRLAYVCDLHGQEQRAEQLYLRCTNAAFVHVNALMNLAVIYEDQERYEEAKACLKRVLAASPNHPRACLFLRDVESSMTMYYDEDQERVRQRHDAIMDIPISDFELSVRSRNCLKKMNIHTVGDLLRIGETELLGYKNFGETSLTEIKALLQNKGLTLGTGTPGAATRTQPRPASAPTGNAETLNKPVSELELSVRSRKCLQRLNVDTLMDLVNHTEADLLGTKNFGQTSLNEIKRRLGEYGLTLRRADR